MATSTKPEIEFQSDFRGGANGVTVPALLKPNEVQRLVNGFAMPGGGVEARKGYKHYGEDTNRGVGIFEFEQSVGTVLTYMAVGTRWYDETMQPFYELFQQNPATNDAVYFGAREKFGQVILNTEDMPITPGIGNSFVFEYYDSGTWVDETSSVVENVANAKQMRGAPGEWIFTYPEQPSWDPCQVETRTYQFYRRIRCSAGGTDMGTNITQSRRLVQGDWVGRRHLVTAFSQGLTEWPGITLTPRNIDIYNEVTNRVRVAAINDHLYIASDGQKPLRRWNGSRGPTRAGVSQVVANAGLTAPTAAPSLTKSASATAYPLTYVLGYCIAFEYGAESRLGESRPSPIAYVGPDAAAFKVRVDFSAAVTQAATLAVNAIRIYATYDMSKKLSAERSSLSNYLLIKRIERSDSDWQNGYYDDTFTARVRTGQMNPILYDNTPPFYPKYIAFGGERLWIANDRYVAWSDIGRGDSWDPANISRFPSVRGLCYWNDRMLVFQEDDISYIAAVNQQLPDIGFFWRGIGLAQPDTIAVGEGKINFISAEGPAHIYGNPGVAELTARGRAWDDDNYWAESAPARNLASACFFQGRVWFGVDRSGAGPGLSNMATYDVGDIGTVGWAEHNYSSVLFGTLACVHCPLDHAEARKRVLLGFPDGSYTSLYKKLTMLEYGTTDGWGTNPYDGTMIETIVVPKAAIAGGADRIKEYFQAHLKIRQYAAPGGAGLGTTTVQLLGGDGESNSIELELAASAIDADQEWRFIPTDSGGGRHRGHGSWLYIVGTSDNGWELTSWMLRATIDEWRPGP